MATQFLAPVLQPRSPPPYKEKSSRKGKAASWGCGQGQGCSPGSTRSLLAGIQTLQGGQTLNQRDAPPRLPASLKQHPGPTPALRGKAVGTGRELKPRGWVTHRQLPSPVAFGYRGSLLGAQKPPACLLSPLRGSKCHLNRPGCGNPVVSPPLPLPLRLLFRTSLGVNPTFESSSPKTSSTKQRDARATPALFSHTHRAKYLENTPL